MYNILSSFSMTPSPGLEYIVYLCARLWKEVVERRQQQPLQLALSMKDATLGWCWLGLEVLWWPELSGLRLMIIMYSQDFVSLAEHQFDVKSLEWDRLIDPNRRFRERVFECQSFTHTYKWKDCDRFAIQLESSLVIVCASILYPIYIYRYKWYDCFLSYNFVQRDWNKKLQELARRLESCTWSDLSNEYINWYSDILRWWCWPQQS